MTRPDDPKRVASDDPKRVAPDDPKRVARSAAAGGASPSLLALAARFRTEGWLEPAALAGELVSLVIVAFLGRVFVWSQKETDMRKAFFLGVSAPALILNALATVDRQESTSDQSAWLVNPWAIQALYAAEQPPETRGLSVEADVPVSGNLYIRDVSSPVVGPALDRLLSQPGIYIQSHESESDDGSQTVPIYILSQEREAERSDDGSWAVPATKFIVAYRGSTIEDRIPVETPWTEVPSGSRPIVIRLKVQDPKQTFWGGLLDGLNLDNWAREFVRSDATAEVMSR